MSDTSLLIVGGLFALIIIGQATQALFTIAAIHAAERRIIEHMDSPLEDDDDLAVWTEVDLPPIDERDFG